MENDPAPIPNNDENEKKINIEIKKLQEKIIQTLELIPEEEKKDFILNFKKYKVRMLFIGPTGVGKRSTINTLFKYNEAKIRLRALPETPNIKEINFENFIVYDTPRIKSKS